MVKLFSTIFFLVLIEVKAPPKFDEEHLYIVARVTKNKSPIIQQFNLTTATFNHIALGLFEKERLNLYDFSDGDYNGFHKQNLSSFITEETTAIFIYATRITDIQRCYLLKQLDAYTDLKFDHEFDLKNEHFYCSEFCFTILNTIFPDRYESRTIPVSDPFMKAYLKRDLFEYIPVDFFLLSDQFSLLWKHTY